MLVRPLLSNLYLHDVLDLWFEHEVKPRLRGRAFAVRFADDAVLAFEREEDARRMLAVLGKRFGKYGLRLHPEKTRLVDFRSPSRRMPGGTQRAGCRDRLKRAAAMEGLAAAMKVVAAGPSLRSPQHGPQCASLAGEPVHRLDLRRASPKNMGRPGSGADTTDLGEDFRT